MHRLAKHLHAKSTQKSRYKISDYSQTRSSIPSKIPLIYSLFESWTLGSCRFQIHLCVHSCMRNELWIHTRFSYEISTSSVSLNLMEMSSKTFNPFSDFKSDQMQRSSLQILTAHYAYMALTLQPIRGCPQHSGETGTWLSSAIHSRLLSWFFLREGGRLYTGYRETSVKCHISSYYGSL